MRSSRVLVSRETSLARIDQRQLSFLALLVGIETAHALDSSVSRVLPTAASRRGEPSGWRWAALDETA